MEERDIRKELEILKQKQEELRTDHIRQEHRLIPAIRNVYTAFFTKVDSPEKDKRKIGPALSLIQSSLRGGAQRL